MAKKEKRVIRAEGDEPIHRMLEYHLPNFAENILVQNDLAQKVCDGHIVCDELVGYSLIHLPPINLSARPSFASGIKKRYLFLEQDSKLSFLNEDYNAINTLEIPFPKYMEDEIIIEAKFFFGSSAKISSEGVKINGRLMVRSNYGFVYKLEISYTSKGVVSLDFVAEIANGYDNLGSAKNYGYTSSFNFRKIDSIQVGLSDKSEARDNEFSVIDDICTKLGRLHQWKCIKNEWAGYGALGKVVDDTNTRSCNCTMNLKTELCNLREGVNGGANTLTTKEVDFVLDNGDIKKKNQQIFGLEITDATFVGYEGKKGEVKAQNVATHMLNKKGVGVVYTNNFKENVIQGAIKVGGTQDIGHTILRAEQEINLKQ